MKKTLLAVTALLITSSLFAKCSDASLAYYTGYTKMAETMEKEKERFASDSEGMKKYRANSYADAYCQLDCMAYLGGGQIKDADKCYSNCLNGSSDFYVGKKPKMTCDEVK